MLLDKVENYKLNKRILLSDEAQTIDDILIKPNKGQVSSRKEIYNNLDRFIYTAPMDTVTDIKIYNTAIFSTSFVCPVLSRVYLSDFFEWLKGRTEEQQVRLLNEGYISSGTSDNDISFLRTSLDFYEKKLWTESSFKNLRFNVSFDVAHGWSNRTISIIRYFKELYCDRINIMTGSIATPEAAKELIGAGANVLRVGIGCGKMCSTRLITGVGVPNSYAVFDIFSSLYKDIDVISDDGNLDFKRTYKIIADGGILYPGDIAKYLAGGANGIMIGTAFANCLDSPAPQDESGMKIHRGQASAEFQKEHIGYIRNGVAEGVTKKLSLGEPFTDKANWFFNGLKSTTSYIGGTKLSHINPLNCKLIKVSNSTYYENKPME